MAKRSDAREQMILAAARLFRVRGYEGVGIAELLEESGAPRGSLYFHFPGGKEEIAVAAIEMAGERVSERLAARRARIGAADGYIDETLSAWVEEMRRSDFKNGCAVALIALEMAQRSPALRDAAAKVFAHWEAEFAHAGRGWGMREADAASFGSAMLSSIEGAIALARAMRTTEPFDNAARAMKTLARAMLAPA